MPARLDGKRIVVTDAERFMGPDLVKGLAEAGAEVIADTRDQRDRKAAAATIAAAGRVDGLVANLAAVNPRKSIVETSDDAWAEMYDVMVHPLHRLFRAVLPQMIERRGGKLVVVGRASTQRGKAEWAAYSSARGAPLHIGSPLATPGRPAPAA